MRRDLVFGTGTLAVSVIFYRMADAIPTSQLADAVGPQGLPKVYAVILSALSLILITRGLRDPGSGIGDPGGSGSRGSRIPDPGSRSFRAIGMLLIGVAYIVLAPWLGYLLSISGLVFATTYYQGGSLTRQSAVVAFCGGVFFWLLFVVMMGISQP